MRDREYAFPETQYKGRGLSKREWFAGQALAGFLADRQRSITDAIGVAESCFEYADAMIAAAAAKGETNGT